MHNTKFGPAIIRTKNDQNIYAKTQHQFELCKSIDENEITVALGPAGTGKTFLATLMAAKYLAENKVDKIVITRPAVMAGENLGFLPGEISNKMDPFLRPIYDVLDLIETKNSDKEEPVKTTKTWGKTNKQKHEEPKKPSDEMAHKYGDRIEIVPFAYMRGRTFSNSIIVVDEANNSTIEQIHMLMTRIGENSKMIIVGDLRQSDLYGSNGLQYIVDKLSDTPYRKGEINIVELTDQDIVRNKLIVEIEKLFDDE